ncbi:MAG: hypothetical protein ACOC16_01080 [Nanoarchaeota archaeon]
MGESSMRKINQKQVEKEHYDFDNYSNLERFTDYYYQTKIIMNFEGKKILNIGVGDNILTSIIKEYNKFKSNNKKIKFKTFDIDSQLKPDYVGDIYNIDKFLFKEKFEVVCLFEVLEHFPKKDLNLLLSKISNITNKYVIISVPSVGITLNGMIKFPYFKKINYLIKFPIYNKINHKEHFWEIGRKNMKKKEFEKIISNNFKIKKTFINKVQGSHMFFICEKK